MFAYLIYLLEHNWSPFFPPPHHQPLFCMVTPHTLIPCWGSPSIGWPLLWPFFTVVGPWHPCWTTACWAPCSPALVSRHLCCPPFTRLWHSVCWTVPAHGSLLPLSGLWHPSLLSPCMDPFLSYLDSGTLLWALQLPSLSYCRYRSPSRSIPNRFRTEFLGKEGKEK